VILEKEAYFPNIGSSSVFLIDLWIGHYSNIISNLIFSPGKHYYYDIERHYRENIILRCLWN